MRYISFIIIGLSFIIGVWILAGAYKFRSNAQNTITVTGSAETDFVSDLIIWRGSYSRKYMDLQSAYAQLKEDENTIRAYLTGKGIRDNEMVISAIDINKE